VLTTGGAITAALRFLVNVGSDAYLYDVQERARAEFLLRKRRPLALKKTLRDHSPLMSRGPSPRNDPCKDLDRKQMRRPKNLRAAVQHEPVAGLLRALRQLSAQSLTAGSSPSG